MPKSHVKTLAAKKHKTQKQNVMPRKSNIMRGVKKSSNKVKGRGGFIEDIGGKAGDWLGRQAGTLLSSVFGMGAYQTRNNTLTNPNNPPVLSNTRSATRVQHREYITDILSSTGFNLSSYPINAGLPTFPWLAGVAQSFEQYKLHGLIFEYKSTSANALTSTNTALGTVIMATEYDSTKPVFTDKRSMENYLYSTSSPPSLSAMHPVECAIAVNVLDDLYVRSGSTTSDIRFNDLGLFQIATIGMQAAGVNIGELWCTYDIELLKPRLPPSISSIAPAHYTFDTTLFTSGTAPAATNLFGTTVPRVTLRGVGASPVTLSGNQISFNTTGTFFVSLALIGTPDAIGTMAITIASGTAVGTGALIPALLSNSGTMVGSQQYPPSGTTSASLVFNYGIVVSVATASLPCEVTYANVTLPTAITGLDLFVTTLPQGFTENPKTVMDIVAELEKRMAELAKFQATHWELLESPSTSPMLLKAK